MDRCVDINVVNRCIQTKREMERERERERREREEDI